MAVSVSISRAAWHDFPAWIGRHFRTLGVVLADGGYLAAWSWLGACAPVLALAAGALPAALQAKSSFTYSLLTLSLFSAVGALGAGLGLYAFVGYVAVDFARAAVGVAWRHSVLGAKPFTYLVLATLLVLVPLAVVALRHELWRLLRLRPRLLRALAQGTLQGLLVFAWAQAAAFLIRPLWSFYNRSPDIRGIAPLQHEWAPFVAVAVLASAARVLAEGRALSRMPAWPEAVPAPARRRPPWLSICVQALVIDALLAGLFGAWWEALIMYAALLVPLVLQRYATRLPPIAWLTRRVPLLLRLVLCIAGAFIIATYVVEPVARSTSSFRPMLISIVLTLFLSAILLPRDEA